MKTITVKLEPELREHIQAIADQKNVDLSKYVRAVLKKSSKYKEKAIVWQRRN